MLVTKVQTDLLVHANFNNLVCDQVSVAEQAGLSKTQTGPYKDGTLPTLFIKANKIK